ncbi:hypothetical protein NDU88_008010, partial [Pleurodeles waltl]
LHPLKGSWRVLIDNLNGPYSPHWSTLSSWVQPSHGVTVFAPGVYSQPLVSTLESELQLNFCG